MLVRVQGHSMYPTLRSGAVLSVDTEAYRVNCPQPGDIVLARHPFRKEGWLVKRVYAVNNGQEYILHGDNLPESTDSRFFGPLRRDQIVGRIVDTAALPQEEAGE